MTLPQSIASRLSLPLIVAPMLRVSGPELVSAACVSGAIGAFPTVNARSADELDAWMARIARDCDQAEVPTGPICPNIIMRRRPEELARDVTVLARHGVEMVIASVGSPQAVVEPLHDVGCLVLADVATMRHAEKALEAGADGLVLLSAGAGGQTGWVNGFAFIRAVRAMFDGPVVLSGGMSDGEALWAAQVAGCDLAMMGTPFIATHESRAADPYKQMLVSSSLDDVMRTKAFTGLETNMLRPSILAAGLDPANLVENISPQQAREMFSANGQAMAARPQRWVDIWSAGHTVSGVDDIRPAQALVGRIAEQYQAARRRTAQLLADAPLA